jgi:hypothetical protein
MIKSRRMRWAGHVGRMGEKRNAYRILVGKPEGKRPLRIPRRRWVDNIKMDLILQVFTLPNNRCFYLSFQNLNRVRKIGAAYQPECSESRKYAEPKLCSLALVFMKKSIDSRYIVTCVRVVGWIIVKWILEK